MSDDRWLPLDFVLADGNHIRSLYVRGTAWQLYTTAEDGQALAVRDELYGRWRELGWIEEGLLEEVALSGGTVHVLCARAGSMLSSLSFGPYPRSRQQAMDFIRALRRSLARTESLQLDSAFYIASFSLILPTVFQDRPAISVASAAGRFLTGGVDVPLSNPAAVLQYAPYLTQSDLDQMLDMLSLARDEGACGTLTASPAAAAASQPARRGQRQQGAFSLPGRPALERFFREEIIDIVDNEEAYSRMGVGFPGGTVLHGPSGCGKTYAVERLTEYLNWPVYTIDSGAIGSKYVHETSRKIAEVFDKAAENAPSVIVIDEMEAFLSSRESSMGSREIHMEEVAEFLRRIPEAPKKRILLFGMTNLLDSMDKAILRKGRIDHIVEVDRPGQEEILALLESLLASRPTEPGLPLEQLSHALKGRPISDISFLVQDAARRAVRGGQQAIGAEELQAAMDNLPPAEGKKRKIGFGEQ
ncbi:MAG: ATP-binding protein [Aristaeellaceae bacterium]